MILNADTADDSLNTQSHGAALSARRQRRLRSRLLGRAVSTKRPRYGRAVGASLPVICKECNHRGCHLR